MPRWFIQQNGKVFGPFDEGRMRMLVAAKQFDLSSQCGESWEGPWRPLSEALASTHETDSSPREEDSPSPASRRRSSPVKQPTTPADEHGVPDIAEPSPSLVGTHFDTSIVMERGQQKFPQLNVPVKSQSTKVHSRKRTNTTQTVFIALAAAVVAAAGALLVFVNGSPSLRNTIERQNSKSRLAARRPSAVPQQEDAVPSRTMTRREVSSSSAATSSRAADGSFSFERNATAGDGLPGTSSRSAKGKGNLPELGSGGQPTADSTHEAEAQPAMSSAGGLPVTPRPQNPEKPPTAMISPVFNPDRIDVVELREVAENLRDQGLSKEDSEIVEDFLSLTRRREWKARNLVGSSGEITLIIPGKVFFRNENGEGPWDRKNMSPASAKVLGRIVERAEDLFKLNSRIATVSNGAASE